MCVRYIQCIVCVRCTECDLCGCGQSIPATAAGLSPNTMTKLTQKRRKEMVDDVKRLGGGMDSMSTISFVLKVLIERGEGEGRARGDCCT